MRAAIDGVDRVGKCKNVFRVAVVILQGDFDFDSIFLAFHVNRRIMQHLFALVQMLDEFGDAARKSKFGGFIAALIGERNFQALVQERELAQARRQNFVIIFVGVEDRRIGMKCDFRAGFARLARDFQLAFRFSGFVRLFPDFAVAPNFQFQPV